MVDLEKGRAERATERKLLAATRSTQDALKEAQSLYTILVEKGRHHAMLVLKIAMSFDYPDLDV